MNWSIKFTALLTALVMIAGCKKDDTVETPASEAHFANQTSGTYFVTAPNVTYKVPIGVTTVSNSARTIKVNITSPTGAQNGTHYTAPSTVTIPAGKALDSLEIKAVYSFYSGATPRKDTLIITLQDADVKASDYNQKFTLVVRAACLESDIVLAELLGDYTHTNEDWGGSPYGPYTTSITAVNQTSATTGTITVSNIFDAGWGPITFKLDWTNPANRTITLDPQVVGGDPSVLDPSFSGLSFQVRGVPASLGGLVGTFSYCQQKLVLKMLIGVTTLGYYPDIYTVNMAR